MKTSRRARPHVQTSGLVLHTNLTLIEVADPLLLEELRADRRLAPLLVAPLSDRAVLVKPGDEEPVTRAYRKAGHPRREIIPGPPGAMPPRRHVHCGSPMRPICLV